MSSSSVPPIQLVIQVDDKTAAAFRGAVDRIKTFKGETDKAGKSLAGLSDAAQQLLKPFGELGSVAGGAFSSIESQVTSLFSALSSGSAVAAIAGIGAAAAAAAAAVGVLAVQGGEYAQRLDLISQKTGISIRDLQVFEAAGSTVGVTLEDLVTASRKFDQALADTGKGAAAQQAVLRALGVTARDPKEALLEVADAFAKITDPTLKSSDAIVLFGKSGLNMIPFLNLGRDGLKEFDTIVSQFGPHITKEGVERFDQWEVATTKLSEAWKTLKNDAGGLLPILTSMVTVAANGAKSLTDFLALNGGVYNNGGGYGATNRQNAAQSSATAKNQDLQDIVSSLKKQDQAEILANQKEYFDLVKAGSAAQYALEQKQQEVATYIAAENFKAAAAAQAQIPALQAAVDLEKARLETLRAQAALAAKFAGTPVAFTSEATLDNLKAQGEQMIAEAKQEEKIRNDIYEITKKYAAVDTSGIEKLGDEVGKFIGSGGSKTKADVDGQAVLNISGLYKNAGLSAQEYTFELQKLHSELRRGKIDQQQYDAAVKSLTESLGGVRGGVKLFFDEFVNSPSSTALLTLDLLNTAVQGFEQNLADTLIKGKADWAGYFASLAEMIIKFEATNLLQSFLKDIAGTGLGSFLGLGSSSGAITNSSAISATPLASGGLLRGPGSGTSDDIPAWLSDHEYVVRADVVRQPGALKLLDRLNEGGISSIYPRMPRFASGGLVSSASSASSERFSGGAPNVAVNIINQSSQPVEGRAGRPKFDGRQYVVGVVIEDLKANGPIRKALGGM